VALAFAVLLLAQAGAPFTTGFLAKFGVVGAAVDAHSYVLAAIAMASAAVAAFFYLRVAVTMYSPVGAIADPGPDIPVETGAAAGAVGPVATDDPAVAAERGEPAGVMAGSDGPGARAGAGDSTDSTVASLSVLTDQPPADAVVERGSVPVPVLTGVAIGLCVAFTVVFGIIPAPIVDFAHQATLLFV
jgi:NADH:ubiquinone oxidoreductase subunit 2 (subunit N)